MSDISDILSERIRARLENVALEAQQRREERDENKAVDENFGYFENNFQNMIDALELKLNQQKDIPENEKNKYLDELVNDHIKIQTYFNESLMFLPRYWIEKTQETLNKLNEEVQKIVTELKPKKKFGFRSKSQQSVKPVAKSKIPNEREQECVSTTSLATQLKERNFFGFKDKSGVQLEMEASDLKDRQFNLQNLENCKVIALGNPSSLQFSNLKNSTIIIGPTSRSAFIKNCHGCNFILACQQIRIHDCEGSKFYIHVTGSAIIENCKGLTFAPYELEYNDKSKHYQESGLSTDINLWNKVEDFNWLNKDQQSPNFEIESDWKKDWL